MRVLNLDELRSEDRKIIFNEKEYILPGEMPFQLWLEWLDNLQQRQEKPLDSELQGKSFDILMRVFSLRNNINTDEIANMIGTNQYIKFSQWFFDDGKNDIEESQKKSVNEEQTNMSTK